MKQLGTAAGAAALVGSPSAARAPSPRPDLDAIESDLAGVEMALARLDTGEYWRDEITGADLDEAVLALHPTARRSADTAD